MFKKFVCTAVATWICLSCFLIGYSMERNPTYIIGAVQSNGECTVDVSIANASATVGRFALEYDTDMLELLDINGNEIQTVNPKVKDIVKSESCITIPTQSSSDGQGVSTDDGYVMFAWYASGNRVDASKGDVKIASIRFELKDGVTEDDFNATTFRLKTVAHGTYPGWWSGAHIATGSYEHYWNNVNGFPQCSIKKDYVNCDVMPIVTFDGVFDIKDGENNPVQDGTISINEVKCFTNSEGRATVELPIGDYGYTVSKAGHESKSGILSISDKDVKEEIVIRTDLQYVNDEIKKIEIVYADGDSQSSVTTSVGLPFDDIGGATLSWKSGNPSVITDSGAVVQQKSKTEVILTLTMTKGEAKATRDYILTVLKKEGTSSFGGTYNGGSGKNDDNVEYETSDDNDGETPENIENNKSDKADLDSEVPNFTDLAGFEWAKESIMTLVQSGVIKGTSYTTFEPGEAIKRGDFVILLVRMFGFWEDTSKKENFADVPSDSYYSNEIAIAKALGIAKGEDETHFLPEENISRQDMMVIVHRAMKLYGIPLKEAESGVLNKYTDEVDISDYALESIKVLVGNELISGNENCEIKPFGMTTRAEVAVLLGRIYRV